MYSWSLAGSLATGFRTLRLHLLIGQEFLRGLLHVLEQTPMIARLVDRGLQFVAQLRQPLESLLVGEGLIQSDFHSHRVSICEFGVASAKQREQTSYRTIANVATIDCVLHLR